MANPRASAYRPRMGDADIRQMVSDLPVPDYGPTPFTEAPPLAEATVALVTTAGFRLPEQEPFGVLDQSFRELPPDRRDLVLSHFSPNFDRVGVMADLNVVYPIDRLDELHEAGEIGALSPVNLAFMGGQDDTMTTIRMDTGPAAAQKLLDAGTDVVLLTPI